MANQIFHFSNTGVSSGQRFYLKDDVSGIFLNKLNINSDRKIEAPNLVYNTGNQNISGVKSFSNNIQVSGTGIFNAVDLNNIDNLNLSGVDVTITNGVVILTNIARISQSGFNLVSGNFTYPVFSNATGFVFTPDASTSTFFDYTLSGNSTLNQPINMNNGQSITIFLTQDSTGNRSMNFNTGYLFSNGITPSLNFLPSGTDILQVIRLRNKLYSTFASNY